MIIATAVSRVVVPTVTAVVAVVAAMVAQRRRPDAPTGAGRGVPAQLDRADFPGSRAPWLVAVFTSASCDACADVLAKSQVLHSDEVDVVDVEYGFSTELHRRYEIEAVPLVVVADAAGVVRASALGPVKAQDLWALVADCRATGGPVDRGGHCDVH